ncbi:MAG: hypothetical protein ACKOFF_06515 [Acidimicrobiales bacterium]
MTTTTEISPDDVDFAESDEDMDEEIDGPRYRRGGRARRFSRFERIVMAAIEGFLRRFGRGDVQIETVGDVLREAVRAALINLGLRKPRGRNA